jgi:hypothetical protein
MSTEYGPTVQWTEYGQGPIPDEQREGRWCFHHTSDTCTWQWRVVGAPDWKDALTTSKEHFATLITAATTPMEEEHAEPQPQV